MSALLIALSHGRRTRLIQGKYRIPLARTQQIPPVRSRKLRWSRVVRAGANGMQDITKAQKLSQLGRHEYYTIPR